MLARVRSATVCGVDAVPVSVEVEIREGKESFNIIGLGDSAIRESKDRVQTAIRSSGFKFPDRVLVNLAPAELRKEGASFDLPIAIAVLIASRQIEGRRASRYLFCGELSLNGQVKSVRGVTAIAVAAVEQKLEGAIVPHRNLSEAALIPGISTLGAEELLHVTSFLNGASNLVRGEPARNHTVQNQLLGFDDVIGQEQAKRALKIAASGGHNLLMIGSPGCGKSMLASRLPSILPPLSDPEKLEVVRIQSSVGLSVDGALRGERPFRSPHHVISDAGLVGGGSNPRPGEMTLAHRGVLFLDEFPEFKRSALEALRAPLESKTITVSRARSKVTFPSDFQLIAAMNPCPCGRSGSGKCLCSALQISRYLGRLSQPILDRIDIHVELQPVPIAELGKTIQRTESNHHAIKVEAARKKQLDRQAKLNAELSSVELKAGGVVSAEALKLFEKYSARGYLSARSFVRVLRVARSIADIEESSAVREEHVAEALNYRAINRMQQFHCLP